MNKPKGNIDLLIERVAVICFFLFILFAFKGNTSYTSDSHRHGVSVDQIWETCNTAVIDKSVSLPDFKITTASFRLIIFYTADNYKIICSNSIVNLLFRMNNEKFLEYKPHITNLYCHHIRSSLFKEEFSLIS